MKHFHRLLSGLLLCLLLAAAFPPAPAAALSDVPDGFWAENDIRRCVELGYIYPESNGSFGVGKELTRAEFLVILSRFFGWKAASPARLVYDDVSEEAWYAGVIESAYQQGVLTNQSHGFRPDDPITRSEAAYLLIRALGYGNIAGLIQDISLPFQDVRINTGYIAMAYGLGLMDGASVTTFNPDGRLTREQAAVLLMRLHEKTQAVNTGWSGILTSAQDIPGLSGCEAVAIAAFQLTYNGSPQLSPILSDTETTALRAAAKEAQVKQLLYVSGDDYHLRENAPEMAAVLLQAVRDGNYDGLFLDITGLTNNTQQKALSETARLLREGLTGGRLLYLTAEAPSWGGRVYGYDYAALGEAADRLVLRIDYPASTAGGIPTAPLQPLEEVYYALNRLRGLVDAGKITLLLDSTGSLWNSGVFQENIPGEEIAALLENAQSYYSSRYACAYLEDGGTVVWYLDGQSIQDRTRLARLFGGGRLCLTNLNGVLPELLAAMP